MSRKQTGDHVSHGPVDSTEPGKKSDEQRQTATTAKLTLDAGGASRVTQAYLNTNECAVRYSLSPSTWRRLVDAGKAPQTRRFGRLVRWSEAELDDWDAAGNPAVRKRRGGHQ